MKRILTLILMLALFNSYSQSTEGSGKIFKSVVRLIEPMNDFEFVSYYYPLKDNIDDTTSTVYIANHPSLNKIETASMDLVSNFYLIKRNGKIINRLTLINKPERNYFVYSPTTDEQSGLESNLKGDITENRANEIIMEKYDRAAKIDSGKLYFNNKTFVIIPEKEIRQEVLDLVTKYQLDKLTPPKSRTVTLAEIKARIVKESEKGGKLDFFTPIKGKEQESVEITPGVKGDKIGQAFYKWARESYNLGIRKLDDVFSLFKQISGREPNAPEKEYLKMGFESRSKK